MDDHPADDRSAWERGGDPKLSTIEGKGRTLGTYLVIELRQAVAAGVDEEHVSPPPSAVATRGAADMMLYTTRAQGCVKVRSQPGVGPPLSRLATWAEPSE